MRTRITILAALALVVSTAAAQNPRQQPGAPITIYAPEQHDLYDGHFVISAGRVYMVGTSTTLRAGTTWTTRRRP